MARERGVLNMHKNHALMGSSSTFSEETAKPLRPTFSPFWRAKKRFPRRLSVTRRGRLRQSPELLRGILSILSWKLFKPFTPLFCKGRALYKPRAMDFMYAGPIANTVWCSISPCGWATLANDRVWTELILNHKIGLAASKAARSIILNAEWKQVTECIHTECTHRRACLLCHILYYCMI